MRIKRHSTRKKYLNYGDPTALNEEIVIKFSFVFKDGAVLTLFSMPSGIAALTPGRWGGARWPTDFFIGTANAVSAAARNIDAHNVSSVGPFLCLHFRLVFCFYGCRRVTRLNSEARTPGLLAGGFPLSSLTGRFVSLCSYFLPCFCVCHC